MKPAVLIIAIILSPMALATEIEVRALMGGAAMLVIDGEREFLKVGETSSSGVTLLSADTSQARVEVDGETKVIELSRRISSRFEVPSKNEVRIRMNSNRQYITPGLINGRSTEFLVDTGANVVAISTPKARQLGINVDDGVKTVAATASIDTEVTMVVLDEVRIGGITRRNVQAVVLPGDLPAQVLLGMTFLQGVDITENSGLMVLTSNL